mmetsp:Transcript_16365/g.47707  ORF Transcript_16365/g.47707 Transcript_16365/m.47707 type:complete len:802 (-) Transcript_16365:66-2471(-)
MPRVEVDDLEAGEQLAAAFPQAPQEDVQTRGHHTSSRVLPIGSPKVSGVDLAHIAKPDFTVWGQFKDELDEASYRASELRGRFTSRMTRLVPIFMVLGAGIVIGDLMPHGRFTTMSRISISLWTSHVLELCIVLAVRRYPRLPLYALEWWTAAWLSALSLNMVFFYPYRLAQVVPAEADVILRGKPNCEWSEADALSRGLAMIIVAGLFTPMQHAQMALVVAITGFAAIGGNVFWPIPTTQPGDAVRTIAVFSLIAAAVARAHWERVRAERTQWHFRRSVEKTTAAWHDSQKQQLAAELQAAETKLASDARSKLIRVVMHDLRSPLLACKNVAEMLGQDPLRSTLAREPHGEQAVTILTTCTTIMENIVSDMLDFERIDSGRLVLVPGPFRLKRLLDDAKTTFASLAQTKGIRLYFGTLSEEAKSIYLVGDVRRLLQCVSNGISNALKFTDEGGSVHISVAVVPNDDKGPTWRRVRISVTDDGVGLTDDELEVLNAPDSHFRQVGRGQLQGNGGTGLGLGISRHMLRLHNDSKLRLASAGHGRGTTFEMDLSLELATEGAESPPDTAPRISTSTGPSRGPSLRSSAAGAVKTKRTARASAPGRERVYSGTEVGLQGSAVADNFAREENRTWESLGASEGAGRRASSTSIAPKALTKSAGDGKGEGLRCLHVEDDAMLQLTIGVTLFGRLGVDYETAGDGSIAVHMMREAMASGGRRFDAVLIDNQMPVMSGAEATREMRRMGYTGLIIGLTGDPIGSPDRAAFEAAGLDACTDKTADGMRAIELLLLDSTSRKRIIRSSKA